MSQNDSISYNEAALRAGFPRTATHYLGDKPNARTYYIQKGRDIYMVNDFNWSSGTLVNELPPGAKAFSK